VVCGQWGYVIVDPDGYTNVRKHPNAKSEILGKLSLYHIFDTPDNSCMYGGGVFPDENSNWMPILIDENSDLVGYVYKKNIKETNTFPQLDMQKANRHTAYFADDKIKISIRVDNIYIKSISVKYGNEEYIIPHAQIKDMCFLPLGYIGSDQDDISRLSDKVSVFKRNDGIYYLAIRGGDGGDVFSAIWIISKNKISFNGLLTHCDFYNVVLDK